MRMRYYAIPTEYGKLNTKLNVYINFITSTNIIIKKNELIKLEARKILINFQIYQKSTTDNYIFS